MSILKVYSLSGLGQHNNDFALRQKSRRLEAQELKTEWFKKLVFDMFETLYADPSGIGLAAPQIGMLLRVVAIDVKRDARKPLLLINPAYEPLEGELAVSRETCLSVPYFSGEVERHKSVRVTALDAGGNHVELAGEKFMSFVYQHEIDHLDGILYIDRIRDKDKLFSNLGYCNAMAERAMDALFPPGGRGDT